jgi:hypothetical protein
MGALITGLGRSRLADLLPTLPAGERDRIAESLGAGGGTGVPERVRGAAEQAFVSALNSGLRIAALLAVVGAAIAWALIAPGTAASAAETEPAPEGAVAAPGGEPVGQPARA